MGVNHGAGLHEGREVPSAVELGHGMSWDPECACHSPRRGPMPVRYLAFVLGSDTMGVATNYSIGPGWLGDPPPGAPRISPTRVLPRDELRWMNATLSTSSRENPRSRWGYIATVAPRGDSTRMFLTRLMPTTWGDTLVYSIEYDREAMEMLLRASLDEGTLLPPTILGERRNETAIALEVARADGAPVLRTAELPTDVEGDSTMLATDQGALRIRARIRPEVREALFLGDAPQSRVPLMLVLLLLALLLTVVAAVQLRREVRFSAERARFVANVSHELRTPLTQVRLVLDTVRLGRERDEEMRRSALETADREVLRLQHLVEGLLRFARGPRADDSPRVPTDVVAEAKRVAQEFQPLAAPRGMRIEVRGADAAMASLRPGALRQVLLNLLDNAVKYGREGAPILIDITVPAGDGPRIAVTDSGSGIPKGDRERVFSPFERLAAAQAQGVGGSGIGLTIVREIAAAHGGNVRVEEGPEGGARLVFQLLRS